MGANGEGGEDRDPQHTHQKNNEPPLGAVLYSRRWRSFLRSMRMKPFHANCLCPVACPTATDALSSTEYVETNWKVHPAPKGSNMRAATLGEN